MLTRTQQIILLAGIACLAVLAIYLPWTHTLHTTGEKGYDIEQPAGYALVFSPPQPKTPSWGIKVDVLRVLIPMGVLVCAMIAGGVLTGEKTRSRGLPFGSPTAEQQTAQQRGRAEEERKRQEVERRRQEQEYQKREVEAAERNRHEETRYASDCNTTGGKVTVSPVAWVLFTAGAVLFLLTHGQELSGQPESFLVRCLGYGCVFGLAALCAWARRTGLIVVATLFFFAVGFDVVLAVYSNSVSNRDVSQPQIETMFHNSRREPGVRKSVTAKPSAESIAIQVADQPIRQDLGQLDSNAPVCKDSNWFVCFPAKGQQRVPLVISGNEVPDPIPKAEDKLAGFPITVTFAPRHAVQQARAELQNKAGDDVAVWFSSPEKPANPRHTSAQSNTICLIARKPLRPSTTYIVSVSAQVDGKDWKHRWTFTTVSEGEERRQIEQQALGQINYYRMLARVPPVVLDHEKSAGCMAHARYLALNLPTHPDLNWNQEDPKLPGATDEGRRAASSSALFVGGGAAGLIDWMLGSFINRHLLLEPNLRSVGLGFALYPGVGHVWALLAKADQPAGVRDDVLVVPVEGQKEVPLAYHMRSKPFPYPASHHDKEVGYAITARFPRDEMPSQVVGRLTDSLGMEVPTWLSTPDQPATTQYRQRWIGLVPQRTLQEGTTYTVTLTGQLASQAWRKSWSFTTISLDEERRSQLAKRLVDMLNRQRHMAGLEPVELDQALSRACDLHCGYYVRNYHHPAARQLGELDEDLTLDGATLEGRNAARASVIAVGPTPYQSVEACLSTFYSRLPLLNPSLKGIGIGVARLPDQNYMVVLGCRRK